MKHGGDFVRLMPSEASDVRTFALIIYMAHSLNMQCYIDKDPPLRASSTLQTVCPATAFQFTVEQEVNNSCYVLWADLPLNKTVIICQGALGKKPSSAGNE